MNCFSGSMCAWRDPRSHERKTYVDSRANTFKVVDPSPCWAVVWGFQVKQAAEQKAMPLQICRIRRTSQAKRTQRTWTQRCRTWSLRRRPPLPPQAAITGATKRGRTRIDTGTQDTPVSACCYSLPPFVPYLVAVLLGWKYENLFWQISIFWFSGNWRECCLKRKRETPKLKIFKNLKKKKRQTSKQIKNNSIKQRLWIKSFLFFWKLLIGSFWEARYIFKMSVVHWAILHFLPQSFEERDLLTNVILFYFFNFNSRSVTHS